MKYIISLVIALLCAITSLAEVTRDGNTFKVESVTATYQTTKTKYIWEDKNGTKYPVYISKKGACYIIKVSKKTNKEYKQYLPKDVQETIKKELKID